MVGLSTNFDTLMYDNVEQTQCGVVAIRARAYMSARVSECNCQVCSATAREALSSLYTYGRNAANSVMNHCVAYCETMTPSSSRWSNSLGHWSRMRALRTQYH